MELSEAIDRRRSIRDFAEKAVEKSIIENALKAGLKAPSYNHLKQWDFMLIKEKTIRQKLVETESMKEAVDDELKKTFEGYDTLSKNMYLDAIPKQKRMLVEAPELLIIVYKPKTQVMDSKRVYDLNCLASVWCCIENILLSLAEADVFGVTFIPQNTPAVKCVLGIPEEFEVAAFIPFGYKAEGIKVFPQKEVKLEDKIHYDKW